MSKDYGGILNELVAGRWRHPHTGAKVTIPIPHLVVRDQLAGDEARLIRAAGLTKGRLAVVSDRFTHNALAKRIIAGLAADGVDVQDLVWGAPDCSTRGVEELRGLTKDADALIAVGSGTINDSVKYATFLDRKPFATFPTSPMTAHFTATASVSFDGIKKSLTTHAPRGVFVDLDVLRGCPRRLIWSAYADVVCRTTAQVDWLLSHRLLATDYIDTPYHLLAIDEGELLNRAADVAAGDFEAIAMVTRMNALMGLGTTFANTTHSGSMAEHMLSHYIDMFAGEDHPSTHHGEQVGVATLAMSRLHHMILDRDAPPILQPTSVDREAIEQRFGKARADACLAQASAKFLDETEANAMNRRLQAHWPDLTAELRPLMLSVERIETALDAVAAPVSAKALGLPQPFWQDAVRYARFTRDRFTMLDLAGDSGELDAFARCCG